MDEVHGLSGSVLVSHGPKVVMRMSAGTADIGTGTVCTSETRFQVGSVSKQFTAAAAMLLVEDGALAVDDPIAESLPGCPPRWRDVTLHHLLSHTSGLGHWPALPGFDTSTVRDADEFLERFATVPLRGAPGTTWHYSSPGYLVVARIVEQVSGHRYGDFVTERILRPLGLEATAVGVPAPGAVAHGYRGARRVDVAEFAALPGAGDVWSTVGDLARYTSAFDTGGVVTSSSREAMTAAHAPIAADPGADGLVAADSYGYGYCLGTLAGHHARFHPGDNPGYRSFLGRLPELDATVVILSNSEDTDVGDVLRQVMPAVTTGEPRCRR
jgi:CubicO group peptidase (beta-lactamase class C family)